MKEFKSYKRKKAKMRDLFIEEGYNDSRYNTRSIADKRYKKPKYKNKFEDTDNHD